MLIAFDQREWFIKHYLQHFLYFIHYAFDDPKPENPIIFAMSSSPPSSVSAGFFL